MSKVKLDITRAVWRYRFVGGKERRERWYPVECPMCGNDRYLRAHDARNAIKKALPCQSCHCSIIGKKGFAAVTGRPKARRRKWLGLQAHLNANPSNLERAIMEALEAQGLGYETNRLIETTTGQFYLVDFMLGIAGTWFAIEVDGAYWHDQEHQQVRDRNKRALLKRKGYQVIVIKESDIRAGHHAQIISQALDVENRINQAHDAYLARLH